jgi:FkbM family methyltransferase
MRNKLHDQFWAQLHNLTGATGRNNNALFHRLFHDLCVLIEPGLVVEIGAFEAGFSKELAKVLKDAKLLAYEANPHVYQRFAPTMPPGVSYINKAVGAVEGSKPFHIITTVPSPEGDVVVGSFNRISSLRARSGNATQSETILCECTTVDQIIADHGNPQNAALWIDAEGAVGDILFGAHQALAGNVVTILVELETVAEWSGQWLADEIRNYLALFGFVPVVRDCETSWQFNEIFVRESALTDSMLELVDGYMRQLIDVGRTDLTRER